MIERASTPLNRVIIFAAWTVLGVVTLAIVALVLMLTFGATASEPIKFKDEFANPATNPLSLGFVVSRGTSPFLHRFANGITLFGAWNVYLLALGNQVKTRAASRRVRVRFPVPLPSSRFPPSGFSRR